MALSIFYCGECDKILAASPDLHLSADCLSHEAGTGLHRGYRALRLPGVDPTASSDLDELSIKYPKEQIASLLEPLAGRCP